MISIITATGQLYQSTEQLNIHAENGNSTYKVLTDVCEIFAIFLQGLFKQHGLRGAPLLHLIAAEHGTSLRDQGGHGARQVVVILLQRVHGMKLITNSREVLDHETEIIYFFVILSFFTSVMSLEAAAALMWRLGCRMELLQSRARANVPTALNRT